MLKTNENDANQKTKRHRFSFKQEQDRLKIKERKGQKDKLAFIQEGYQVDYPFATHWFIQFSSSKDKQ